MYGDEYEIGVMYTSWQHAWEGVADKLISMRKCSGDNCNLCTGYALSFETMGSGHCQSTGSKKYFAKAVGTNIRW